MKAVCTLLVVSSLTAPRPPASIAPGPSPVEEGESAYRQGRYEEAAAAFARAYEHNPDPAFLYAQAQALRKAGDCRKATTLYRQFLDTDPPEEAERTARDNMAACAELLAAQPPEPEPEPAPAPEPLPEHPAADTEPQPRPWYRDPWGGALVGIGVAGLAVGGGLYGQATTDERSADEAETDPEYGRNIERASTLSKAGIAMFAVGSALVLAGVVRWAVLAAKSRRQARATARWQGPTFTLRF